MITKWIGIPYGILVVIMAGFTKTVIPEYLSSYSMWYSSYPHYSMIEYALAFGIFGGIITGLIVDTFSQRISMILASLLALIAFWLIPQFDGSNRNKLQNWQFYVLVSLVFTAGQSASLALLATIKVNILNFNITVMPVILSIMLSYFYISDHFENNMHWNFFAGIDTKAYMVGIGIATGVVYAAGAFILTIEEGGRAEDGVAKYHTAMLDKVGLSVFVVFEVFMVLLFLLFTLVIKDLFYTWIVVILVICNFLIPIINAEWILNRAADILRGFKPDVNDIRKLQKGKDKNLFASFKSLRLILLIVASAILVGTGSEIYEKLSKIAIAINMSNLTEYAMIWFVFGDFVTRLIAGILTITFNFVNDFTFLLIFGVEILISMILIVLTPSHSVIIFNLACFLGGSGVGGLWVMTPVIITQDYGKGNFGILWGTTTLAFEISTWVFSGLIFDKFYESYSKDRWGRCTQTQCFSKAFLISAVFSLLGLVLIIFCWYTDEKESNEPPVERNPKEEVKNQNPV